MLEDSGLRGSPAIVFNELQFFWQGSGTLLWIVQRVSELVLQSPVLIAKAITSGGILKHVLAPAGPKVGRVGRAGTPRNEASRSPILRADAKWASSGETMDRPWATSRKRLRTCELLEMEAWRIWRCRQLLQPEWLGHG